MQWIPHVANILEAFRSLCDIYLSWKPESALPYTLNINVLQLQLRCMQFYYCVAQDSLFLQTGRKTAAVHYSPFFAEFLIWWWWAPFGATRQCTLCRVWCTSAVLGGEHAPDLGEDHAPDLGGEHAPDLGGEHAPDLGGEHAPDLGGEHAPDCQIGKEWATRLGGSRERELSRSNNWPCWLSRGEEMRDQQHRFHCNATSTEGSARWQIFCQFTSK